MRISELSENCGDCPLIDFCTEPYETPQLCAIEILWFVDVDEYKQIAENITDEEIADKLRQYEENNISHWSDERSGAILDIVLEKLEGGAEHE